MKFFAKLFLSMLMVAVLASFSFLVALVIYSVGPLSIPMIIAALSIWLLVDTIVEARSK